MCIFDVLRMTLIIIQGPVVQSVVSLTSSLVVKILTVLVSTISNSQVVLLKKCEKLLAFFFSKNIRIQSTPVISNSKGLTEPLRDIRTSTYQS